MVSLLKIETVSIAICEAFPNELCLASLPPHVGDVAHDDEDGGEHGESQDDEAHLEPRHAPRLLHLLLLLRGPIQSSDRLSFPSYREFVLIEILESKWSLLWAQIK